MQIWYPATATNQRAATANTCAQLQVLPLANAENARRLILYMPHFGGVGGDNSQRLSYLASYGYIAVAFDDIALDEARADAKPEEEDARLFTWHVSTQADYERAMSLSDMRVRLQAEKALSGLNRLGACAAAAPASPWSKTVDYAHVGFLGFSFGGSTAAEAGAIDARVVAVANLDGSLFGQAYAGRLAVPYLYVMGDRPTPTMASMMSKDPEERYGSRLAARDLRVQARLAARQGSAGIRIKGSVHASLSDAVLEPHASRLWLFRNPIAFYNAANRYTLDFFNVHLRGEAAALVDQRSSSIPVVQTLREAGITPDNGTALPPVQDAAGAPVQ